MVVHNLNRMGLAIGPTETDAPLIVDANALLGCGEYQGENEMDLVHEFTFRATLKPPLPIGAGPIGTRMYYEVSGGEVVGARLRGAVRGGGEWALIGPDGYLRVDVRAQVETHDGAFLYLQYFGLLEMNTTVQNAIGKGLGTEFTDQYFYTNPRFETGDARYLWLNTTFFIGEGRALPGNAVEYRVWRPA